MRFLFEILKLASAGAVGAALLAVFNFNFHILGRGAFGPPTRLSYADMASINLTAATVALGAVALIVALAAMFGFHVIKAESVRAAEDQVKKELPKLVEAELQKMAKNGQLRDAIEKALYADGLTYEREDGQSPSFED
ncbi:MULTISPECIES: hypothetical protein [Brucella/Ochrobactrum group]|uniref:hypothetical protein n=1 Tax=Brucella/Ochrobactrum group TaxID=2826938 RepID=UPI000DEFCCE5|nr:MULTISPECIES: hypothetical protein [Brucella/Ochrobactrum group]WGG58139.1 hypothetical protein QA414_07115 [Brucella intermedia]